MLASLLAVLIGVVSGMRTMTAPTAVCWMAYLGRLELGDSWLWFLGSIWTCLIFTVLALGEFVGDQLPSTPSRTVPVQFGARLISGGLCGAAVGADAGMLIVGLLCGVVGAVIGTLGGRAFRGKLAASFGRDQPAAFIEDAVAILGALLIAVVA